MVGKVQGWLARLLPSRGSTYRPMQVSHLQVILSDVTRSLLGDLDLSDSL